MTRLRRILRWATQIMFHWMAFRVALAAAMIGHGWHHKHPEWNPWTILLDAGTALVMYGILWMDERGGRQ